MHGALNVSFKYQDWFFNESIIWILIHYVKTLVFESYMNYLQNIKTLIVYKLAMQKFLHPSFIYSGLKSPWDIHALELLRLEKCFQTPPNGIIWLSGPPLGWGYLHTWAQQKACFIEVVFIPQIECFLYKWWRDHTWWEVSNRLLKM
jgi:hypothetical protein